MKFLIIAAAAALTIQAEEQPEEFDLAELDQAVDELPTEELEEIEANKDEEGWERVAKGCKKLEMYWHKYKHLGKSVR